MEILFKEPQPIPFHAVAAMIAIILGGVQIAMKKGGPVHKFIGRVWVVLILFISFSSFFIYQIKPRGNYSPIHLLSMLVIISTGLGVYFARSGNIKRHKLAMVSVYGFALIIAGLFTLLPGRVMHQIVFG